MKLLALLAALHFISINCLRAECLESSSQAAGVITMRPASEGELYHYVEYLPGNYSRRTTWPLIIMLHGAGEVGENPRDLTKLFRLGPLRRVHEGREFPAVIITPQTAENWDEDKLAIFLNHMVSKYKIDSSRIYLTGVSRGGGGVWRFLRKYPKALTAAIPICGAAEADYSSTEQLALKSLPIYAVHNWDDFIVDIRTTWSFSDSYGSAMQSRNEVLSGYQMGEDMTAHFDESKSQWIWKPGSRQLRKTPRNFKPGFVLAIDASGGHDSWTKTYQSEDTWNWLFCQQSNK